MKNNKILNTFGSCYNKGNFDSMENMLRDNVLYDSYDCIYRVNSPKEVIKVLNQSVPEKTSAYSGFYMHRGIAFKRLRECILICDDDSLACIKIVNIKIRRKKAAAITGYNPEQLDYNRGKKIGV